MNRAVLAIPALLALVGCASPKLTRHYANVDESIHSSDELKLSVFVSNSKPTEEMPLVLKLSERGQAELIRSVTARLPADSSAAALLTALSKEPALTSDRCAWANTTVLKKRVTITVLGDMGRPADRIDRLTFEFDLQKSSDRAEFSSWDRFDSVYGSYDLGSAKYTQSSKLTFGWSGTDTKNLPADAGSTVNLLSFGAEASEGLEENMNYAIRRLSVGGSLEESKATLVQEGGPYINLLGSSSAVFTLKLKDGGPIGVHMITFPQGRTTSPDKVEVTRCEASYPSRTADLEIAIKGSALKRKVLEHHETLGEGDDWVTFQPLTLTSKPLIVATSKDLETRFFGLAYCMPAAAREQCLRLGIENPETGLVTDAIKLQTPDEAAKLREWLVASSTLSAPSSIGLRRIGLVKTPEDGGGAASEKLTPLIVGKFRVELVGGNVGAR